ncbi:hypothetical protein L7F22_066232 [Adiantum nelumboides]|nr:hypothetical protein [Adiantum nelumboides]
MLNLHLPLKIVTQRASSKRCELFENLYCYQSAFKFLKEQMEQLPAAVVDTLQNVYKDTVVYEEQSLLGNHDLSGCFKGGCEAKFAPPLAEFVGLVTIGLSSLVKDEGFS